MKKRTSTDTQRRWVAAWIALTLSTFAGCRAPQKKVHRPRTARETFDLDAALAERRRKISALGKEPAAQCRKRRLWRDMGWLRLLHGGNLAKGNADFVRAETDPWALYGRAIIAEATLQPQAALRFYLKAVEALRRVAQRQGEPCPLRSPVKGGCILETIALQGVHALLAQQDVRTERLVKRLNAVTRHSKCGSAVRWAHSALLDLARRQGRGQRLRQLSEQAGCPRRWALSPRFGHHGELDLMIGYPPAPTRGWRAFEGKTCGVFVFSPDGLKGIRELRLRFRLREKTVLRFWVKNEGRNFSLAVDGTVHHRPVRRSAWPSAQTTVEVPLAAGVHRVSLRVPTGMGRYRLEVRVTDAHGRRPSLTYLNPVFTTAIKGIPRRAAGGVEPPPARGHGDAVAELSCKEKAFEPLADYLAARCALGLGRVARGQMRAARMLSKAPRFVAGKLLAARMALTWPMGDINAARERAIDLFVAALAVDENAHLALARRLRLVWRANRYEEALRLSTRGMRSVAHGVWWQIRARLLQDKQWLTLADRAAAEAVRYSPASRRAWRTRLSVARQRNHLSAIRTAAVRLSRLDRSSDVWARLLLERGRGEAALKEYTRLLQIAPYARHLHEGRARALVSLGRHGAANRIWRRLIQQERWNPDLRLDLAAGLLERGRRRQAAAVLRAGRRTKPSSLEIRRALGGLDQTGLFAGFRVDTQKAIAGYRQAGPPPGARQGAVFVLDRTVDRVLKGGALLQLTHQIIHLRSKADLKRWGQVTVPDGVEVLKLRTIKADLTIREPEERSATEPINLPNLEVGDFVEVETTVTRPPLAVLEGGFMGRRFYFRSRAGAMHRSEYVLITPPDLKVQVDMRCNAPTPTIEHRTNFSVREWKTTRQARLESEPHSPPPQAVVPSVRAAANVTWQKLARMVSAKLLHTDRAGHTMRALARRVCRGKAELACSRALYRWVNKNIEQNGSLYDDAAETLRDKSGYRLTLLRALLELAGVNVSTYMVEPVHRHFALGKVPGISGYRFPVLRVAPKKNGAKAGDGQTVHFLFPFIRWIPFGTVPAMLRGARGLRVTGGAPRFITLPAEAGSDMRSVALQIRLRSNGSAEVTVREQLEGWPAVMWRRNLERLSRRRVEQLFQKGRLAPHFPGAELVGELKIKNSDRPQKPLVLRYRFKIHNLARRRKNRLVLRRTFFPQKLATTYLTRPNRKNPLLFGAHPRFRLTIDIAFPDAMRVEMLSPNVEIKSTYGHFSRRVVRRTKKRRVRISIRRQLPFARVETKAYARFGRFARAVDGGEEIVAVFTE